MTGDGAPTARGRKVRGAFVLHLLLALFWMALMGWTGANLLIGLAIGLVAIGAGVRVAGSAAYLRALAAAARLVGAFLLSLVHANLRLARDILRRRPRFAPALICVDARGLGPVSTLLLVDLVALTPGSVVVDIDRRGRRLFVHTLYAADEEAARRDARRFARLLRAIAGGEPEPEEAR